MKGFLLHLSDRALNSNSSRGPVHFKEDVRSLDYVALDVGLELFTWGDGLGDLYVSCKKSHSLFILNGYITDAPCLSPFKTQQEACTLLHQYLDCSEVEQLFNEFSLNANGSFSCLYLSFSEKVIFTLTDRLASRSFFYSHKPSDIYISSHAVSIARLSEKSNSYDTGCLGAYLLYSCPVEPVKSLFSGISCQQEGTLFQHRVGCAVKKTKWHQYCHVPDVDRTAAAWVKLISDCLLRSAERLLTTTSNPLLFFSGGVDSRISATAFKAVGAKPLLCTLGDSNNLETRIASTVARVLRCQHVNILRDEEWYLRTIPRAMFNSHGMYSWIHSHFSEAFSTLNKSYSIDSIILGSLCEAFSKLFCAVSENRKQVWTPEDFFAEFDSIPLPSYRPVNRERTLGLLREDCRKEAEKNLKYDILHRYESISNVSSDPLIIGDYFFRWQTIACLAPFQMFNDVRLAGPERNLMFDNDLLGLLEIIPSFMRSKGDLGARLVHHLCPAAAMIPNANSLLPLLAPDSFHSFARAMKPKLGKVRRFLFSDNYQTTGSWPHLPMLYSGNTVWKRQIEERLLDPSALPTDFFDRAAVEACWRTFCAGDITLHSDIDRLFGLTILGEVLR